MSELDLAEILGVTLSSQFTFSLCLLDMIWIQIRFLDLNSNFACLSTCHSSKWLGESLITRKKEIGHKAKDTHHLRNLTTTMHTSMNTIRDTKAFIADLLFNTFCHALRGYLAWSNKDAVLSFYIYIYIWGIFFMVWYGYGYYYY